MERQGVPTTTQHKGRGRTTKSRSGGVVCGKGLKKSTAGRERKKDIQKHSQTPRAKSMKLEKGWTGEGYSSTLTFEILGERIGCGQVAGKNLDRKKRVWRTVKVGEPTPLVALMPGDSRMEFTLTRWESCKTSRKERVVGSQRPRILQRDGTFKKSNDQGGGAKNKKDYERGFKGDPVHEEPRRGGNAKKRVSTS